MNFCILGIHRRRKLVNIGEEEENGMSSGVNFNVGGACALQNIHTRMHAYIYTHIYSEVNFMLRAACALQNIHTHMHAQIYTHVDASVKSRQS